MKKSGFKTDSNIIILSPYDVKICKRLISEGMQWVFLGTSSCLREKLINLLGIKKRYCYAQEFQNVYTEAKKDFLDWIGEIGKMQSNYLWWANSISYKNPYSSNLFLTYCYILLILRWLEGSVKGRIVIVENPMLINFCFSSFDSEPVCVIKNKIYIFKNTIQRIFFSHARTVLFLLRVIRMWSINKLNLLTYRKSFEKKIKDKFDVLICTWIENRSFNGDRFIDPYLGALYDFYKEKGMNIGTITLPIFPYKLLSSVYKSGEIIPTIYFIGLLDTIKSYFKAILFKVKNLSNNNGLNLKDIFNYELIYTRGDICYAYLHYCAIMNMFKNYKLSCRTLIYPFENQPWDKMMIMALRNAGASCRIVGYQNTVVSEFLLNYFLGKNEASIHPQPDIIISNGKFWGTVLERAGFTCQIKNGGNIRFKCNESYKAKDLEYKNNILVILSSSLNYSLDILFYLIRTNDITKKFLVKPHPDLSEEVVRKHIPQLPVNFTFVKGTMDECLEKVDSAIHIGTTAAIECLMHGVRVYKYLPERIDMDPLLGINIMQNVVTDSDIIDFNKKGNTEVPNNINNLLVEPLQKKVLMEIGINAI